MQQFQFLYPLVGLYFAEYLGAEHAFRLASTATWALEPPWMNFVAARQHVLRLVPRGNYLRAISLFTSASSLDLLVRHENEAAGIGIQLRSLPAHFRRVSYTLDVRS